MFKKNTKGFTLVELLVVIAIISLLSSVVLTSLNAARSKGRDAKRLSDVSEIQKALALYYSDHGSYPIMSWGNSIPSGYWSTLTNALVPDYLPSMPKDPTNQGTDNFSGYNYAYFAANYGGSGQWYMIVFRLENSPSPIESSDGTYACNGVRFHYGSGSNGIVTVGPGCAI